MMANCQIQIDGYHANIYHTHLSYTFKALGAGFYGLRNASDFRKTIMQVVMQAGDADRYATIIHMYV